MMIWPESMFIAMIVIVVLMVVAVWVGGMIHAENSKFNRAI